MIADTPAVEAARREWHTAIRLNRTHQEQCDAFVCNVPCGGCDLFLFREQAAHRRYVAARFGGR